MNIWSKERAISSLSAACKIGEDETPQCYLNALVTIFASSKGTLQLNSNEAKTIAKNWGGIFSSHHNNYSAHNTLDRNLEVDLLCTLEYYKKALTELCLVGEIEAMSLVSCDGVPSEFKLTSIKNINTSSIVEPRMIGSWAQDVLPSPKEESLFIFKIFTYIVAYASIFDIFMNPSNDRISIYFNQKCQPKLFYHLLFFKL